MRRSILTATFFLSILAAPASLAQLVTISLDMLPQELVLDRAGSRALLVNGFASRQRLSDGDGETNLVLVDLDTQAVIKKKRFAKQIRAVHMDDQAVYMAPAEGTVFYRLARDELKLTKRLFVDDPINGFASLPTRA